MSAVSLSQVPARTVSVISGVDYTVRDDASFVKGTHKSYVISPDVCTTGPITGVAPIAFRLHRDTFKTVDKAFLTLDILNPATNTAPLSLVSAPWVVSRIDVMLNGTIGTPFQSITGKDIYESLILLTPDELQYLCDQDAMHMDPNSFFPNGYEIPVGVTRHFRVPLLTSLISRFNLQTIKEDIIIHVYLANTPLFLQVGVENAHISACHLEFRSFEDPMSDRSLVARAVGGVERYIPFCFPVHQDETVTLTDSMPSLLNINLIGDFAGLSVVIRNSSSSINLDNSTYIALSGPKGSEGFDYLAKLDLLGPDRQSLLGSGAIPAAQARFEAVGSQFPSGADFARTNGYYLLPFSMNMAKSISHGERHGEMSMDGNTYLSITPSSDSIGTFTTGVYNVHITGYRYAGMALQDGVFTRMK